MGNLNIPKKIWLKEMFKYHYCENCGGDIIHHTAIPFMGNWFARCDYPMNKDNYHPVIKKYHKSIKNN